MSQARSFTIELTQVGTGKKATVKVNQAGYTPEYTFKWNGNNTPNTNRISARADGLVPTYGYDGNFDPYGKVGLDSWKSVLNSPYQQTHVSFTITSNNDSIVKKVSGTTRDVEVELLPNPTYSERSVTFTLTQKESGKTLTLIITQAAKADDGVFRADPTALSFEASSDTKSSKITSTSKGQTVGWTVSNKSSIPSWLTISGEGTGTLSADVKDND